MEACSKGRTGLLTDFCSDWVRSMPPLRKAALARTLFTAGEACSEAGIGDAAAVTAGDPSPGVGAIEEEGLGDSPSL